MVCAILVEGIMEHIHVKSLYIWVSCSEGEYFLSTDLMASFFGRENHLCNFARRQGEHSCEIILNLNQWFRRRRRLRIFLI